MIQEIKHNNQLLAIIISNKYSASGIHFFTPYDLSQQMAFMKHPQAKISNILFEYNNKKSVGKILSKVVNLKTLN